MTTKPFMNSITTKMILILLALITPIIGSSIYMNYQTRQIMITEHIRSHTELVASYANQLDHELSTARSFMHFLTHSHLYAQHLSDPTHPDYYYTSNQIHQDISQYASTFQYIGGFFMFYPETDFYYLYCKDSTSKNNLTQLSNYIRTTYCDDSSTHTLWQLARIGEHDYLFQGYSQQGIYGGAFVNLSYAMNRLSTAPLLAYVPTLHREAVENALTTDQLFIAQNSTQAPLTLYEVIDKKSLITLLPFSQKFLLLVSCFLILLLPLLFLLLRRIILLPLHTLLYAMKQIQNGSLAYQIPPVATSYEFDAINQTFNQMTQEIQGLKIAVYEETLRTQKSLLQNLSYQLRPHFMINSLNMVYNYITTKHDATALELICFSVDYLRYMLHIDKDFVPLADERQHLQNYLAIQHLRYRQRFTYCESVDPFVADVAIPPMLLQNFIENSLKYCISTSSHTQLSLTITYEELATAPYVRICIKDNGPGYPPDLLEALNANDLSLLQQKVGVRNTLQRIHMLYAGKAHCHFYNDNGAVSTFLFPLS